MLQKSKVLFLSQSHELKCVCVLLHLYERVCYYFIFNIVVLLIFPFHDSCRLPVPSLSIVKDQFTMLTTVFNSLSFVPFRIILLLGV